MPPLVEDSDRDEEEYRYDFDDDEVDDDWPIARLLPKQDGGLEELRKRTGAGEEELEQLSRSYKKQRMNTVTRINNISRITKRGTEQTVELNEDKKETELIDLLQKTNYKFPSDKLAKGIMAEEKSLQDFEVYTEVTEANLPKGTEILSSRWVHKWKDDSVKSRLVVRGFEQSTDTEASDTYTSTPSLTTLLTLITIALARNWFMSTGDVSTAFLHAALKETVYIRPPPELRKKGIIWRLLRALYGLKTAPKAWSDHLAKVLTEQLQFTRCSTDGCLYFSIELKIWLLVFNMCNRF